MLQLFIELPVRKTQNHFKANIYYWKFLWISILSISVTRIEIWYFDNLRFKQCHFRKYSPKKNHHLFFHILEIALSRIGKDSMHLFIWWKTHYICSLFSGKSCKMNVNFWDRIFEKFIVTEEAPLPYMLPIVYYSLDTLFVWEHTRHSNKSLYITRYVPLWKCTIEHYFLKNVLCSRGFMNLDIVTKKKRKKKENVLRKRTTSTNKSSTKRNWRIISKQCKKE